VLLGACQQGGTPQQAAENVEAQAPAPTAMDWARAALGRNPQLEVIAADDEARVFTVRDRQTGAIQAIKLDELAAAPISQLSARPAATPTPAEPAATSQVARSDTPPSESGSSLEQARSEASRAQVTPSSNEQPTSSDADGTAGYTIERSGGQIRVSGPGVSIVSAGGGQQAHEGVSHSNSVEPIICEGKRMVHLDGRQIFVDGNAITVRGGCELYVTNSRVVATGTGIVVQDGTVHISNSHIEGEDGSFDANDQAKLFVRASTFQGISRRAEGAVVQDQGGNRWR
jgi:hypothetical protein